MKLANRILSLAMALAMAFGFAACSASDVSSTLESVTSSVTEKVTESSSQSSGEEQSTENEADIDIASIPSSVIPFDGHPFVAINDNVPFFTDEDITTEAFETYSPLDELGRCGVAYANICQELMPTEDRESISDVTPSGWDNNPYDFIDGGYLYNRCHLIGFQLAGENANELNLITGTRFMNVQAMLPYENMVADYVKETGNHVLYRVTPIFEGDNLVASGVLMEAKSVEDDGEGIEYCIYAYNAQPGVDIDYATGANWANGTDPDSMDWTLSESLDSIDSDSDTSDVVEVQEYVLNTNSMKFHYPDCSGVEKMSDSNRQDVTATRDELIARGYEPCGICNP